MLINKRINEWLIISPMQDWGLLVNSPKPEDHGINWGAVKLFIKVIFFSQNDISLFLTKSIHELGQKPWGEGSL